MNIVYILLPNIPFDFKKMINTHINIIINYCLFNKKIAQETRKLGRNPKSYSCRKALLKKTEYP